MTEKFSTIIASDEEHEQVFAEIYCHGKFVALVSQEEGGDQLRIEFPAAGFDETMIARTAYVEDFQKGLAEAIERLIGGMQ